MPRQDGYRNGAAFSRVELDSRVSIRWRRCPGQVFGTRNVVVNNGSVAQHRADYFIVPPGKRRDQLVEFGCRKNALSLPDHDYPCYDVTILGWTRLSAFGGHPAN